MAGVEQATAPGASAPDNTPDAAGTSASGPADPAAGTGSADAAAEPGTRTGRRAARRRASQKGGQLPDAVEPDRGPAEKPAEKVAEKRSGRRSRKPARAAADEPTPKDPNQPATGTGTGTGTGQHSATDVGAGDRAATGAGPSQRAATTGTGVGQPGTGAGQHAVMEPQHATDTEPADPPRVSLTKAGRPAHARAEDREKDAPGQALVPARAPRAAGPAHAGAPTYRPRHAKRRRRRWPAFLAAGVVLVALAGVGAAALINRQNDQTGRASAPAATNIAPAPVGRPAEPSGEPSASGSAPAAAGAPAASAAPAAGTAECRYTPAADKTPKIVPPARATRSGLVKATIGTSRGPVTLELDATNAPCTVESFLTLAAGNYYNDTACHRLTTLLIFVLQCGDPTALGSGDPGYSFDDENLPAPGGTPYPRGTLAMANAGPDTNGSQFFIVYRDSPIDPNYPVFGKVTGGLEIIDRVAAGGAPENDGQPNESIVVQSVQVG